ncbi:MAG: hypothetical protein LBD04_12625 [Synergistaceae bacterium]|nr:hypothetical protein [Synergistaceae bacterium]
MRTCVFKLYCSKPNKRIHRKLNLAGSIYNHLVALYRRYYRILGGEKISGVKIHIAVDVLGLPYAFLVTTTNITDRDGAVEMFSQSDFHIPTLKKYCALEARVKFSRPKSRALQARNKNKSATNVDPNNEPIAKKQGGKMT